ncbi:S41 family peptidase [uncultured Shewanella sp.]|uniref:S41 family peptidase n=1 Tax=uncultured Shewanella sp. TaxID=173975 RepID=UPI002618E824|nr:S41 family peptidase [uncultured Shewanella sp.]
MRLINAILSTALLLSLTACHSDHNNKTSMDADSLNTELEGIWYSRDYGEIKQIEAETVTTLQVSNHACMLAITIDPDALISANHELTETGLLYQRPYDSAGVEYVRLDDIHQVCPEGMITSAADGEDYVFDAQKVFSSFWHDMNTHYAFFKQRKINWEQIYSLYYDNLAGTSEEELKAVFSDILAQLKDGHTAVVLDFEGNDNDISFSTKPSLEEQLYQDAIELGFTEEQRAPYVQEQLNRIVNNISDYLTDESKAEFLTRDNINQTNEEHNINWGIMEQKGKRIGYLVLENFINFDDHQGIERTDITPYNRKFDHLIEKILIQLTDTDELILDIRNNGGGYDMQGLQLARRFLTQEITAWNISVSYQGELSFQKQVKAQPHEGTRYLNPVSVLISPSTFSAAETFAMVMHNLPQVTMVGEETGGATSDTMPRLLPNHWFFNLSNEYYQDSEGNNYEIMGIQPDLKVAAYDPELRTQGRDSAIEAALHW